MTSDLPAPLVGPEVDLSKLDAFMLDTRKLLSSELLVLANPEEFRAAVVLWCRAWQQTPAASLPDDDRVLAGFALLSKKQWMKIRTMALRGFVKCSDGRLYHQVLAADALRAWTQTQRYNKDRDSDRERLKEWRKKRSLKRVSPTVSEGVSLDVSKRSGNAHETTKTGQDISKLASCFNELVAVARIDRSRKPVHAGPLSDWLAQGACFDRDVLPTIRAIAERETYRPPDGLAYFRKAVLEARDRRIAADGGNIPLMNPAERRRFEAEQDRLNTEALATVRPTARLAAGS